MTENTHRWSYSYDPNGNMDKLVFGKTEHVFEYDGADRLVRYNTAALVYDPQGRMLRNHKQWEFRSVLQKPRIFRFFH